MKTRFFSLLLALFAFLGMASVSVAAPIESWGQEIEIIGYDIFRTIPLEDRTGPGGPGTTSAFYTGSTGSAPGGLRNYTGGGGTLNDGILDGAIDNGQQMFSTGQGTSIRLYFNAEHEYSVNGLFFSGGDPSSGLFLPNNVLPGGISGMGMVVGKVTTGPITTTKENFIPGPYPFLYNGDDDIFADDFIDLTGGEYDLLRAQAVQSIVLNNFDADTEIFRDGGGELFTLSEIQVFGEIVTQDPGPAPVPEPSTVLLLGLGLIALAAVGRKRLSNQA